MPFSYVILSILFISTLACTKKSDPEVPAAAAVTIGTDHLLFTYKAPAGNSEIYSSMLDGSNPVRLTNSPTFDSWWPKASPDRKKILYYRAPSGSNEDYGQASLMLMNADGTGTQTLIAQGANGWTIQAHAEWSPNGNELVMCGTQGGVIHIFVTATDGVIARQLVYWCTGSSSKVT